MSEDKEEHECPDCKRIQWIYEELMKMGYDLQPDEVAAVDGLLEEHFYPWLTRIVADVELLRFDYDDQMGFKEEEEEKEDQILGSYEKQIEKKEDEKPEK